MTCPFGPAITTCRTGLHDPSGFFWNASQGTRVVCGWTWAAAGNADSRTIPRASIFKRGMGAALLRFDRRRLCASADLLPDLPTPPGDPRFRRAVFRCVTRNIARGPFQGRTRESDGFRRVTLADGALRADDCPAILSELIVCPALRRPMRQISLFRSLRLGLKIVNPRAKLLSDVVP